MYFTYYIHLDSFEDENSEPTTPATPEESPVTAPPCPEHEVVTESISAQIPLQRIAMSVRNNKKRGSKILKSGWMVHFTDSDETVCVL